MTEFVVAVDGGGSKTDAAAVGLDGTLLARRRGPGSSPDFLGVDGSIDVVDALVREVSGDAVPLHVGLYLSGLDLPVEIETYRAAVASREWAGRGLAVDNDLFALLRAGTDASDAIVVVCGTGVNALGVRADGVHARFPALGAISGDWGGGMGLGQAALWHAARHLDGRGVPTLLTDLIRQRLGVAVPRLIEDLHFGRREHADLALLAPDVLAAAQEGDAVATRLVDKQADEVVAFVRAVSQRLGLAGQAIPVVLGGGLLASTEGRLHERVEAGLAHVAPLAHTVLVTDPPVLGGILLGLERADAAPEALLRARTAWRDAEA